MFERHTVFDNLELAMTADKRARSTLFARLGSAELDRIADTLALVQLGDVVRPAGRACCRTARSSGWRSACC